MTGSADVNGFKICIEDYKRSVEIDLLSVHNNILRNDNVPDQNM